MQIQVKSQGYETVMNEDGEFVCPHYDVDVEPPCCSTRGSSGYIECGCGGDYNIYCNDCKNEDMTDSDYDRVFEDYIEGRIFENECRD